MDSIRRRLTLLLAASFAVSIAAAGVYAGNRLSARLEDEFDASLLSRLRALSALLEQGPGRIELDYTPGLMPEFGRADRPDYFQLWLDDGTVLYRSARLGENDLAYRSAPEGEPTVRDVTLPDGRPGRQAQLAFRPRGPGEDDEPEEAAAEDAVAPAAAEPRTVVLAVARGRGRLDALLQALQLTLVAAGGAATALAALLAWRALVSGLAPLERLAAEVEGLDAESLHRRIDLPCAPAELAPVVGQLNALLERLDESFARERRFTGNVAHELRTPLAELRALAEVGGKWPNDPATAARFFDDAREISLRMERVVNDLLLLARCQSGLETVEPRGVDLRELAAAAWSRLAARASERGIELALDLPQGLVVETDPGKLDILVSNLLDNAVSHSPPGARVRCRGGRDGGGFRIEISNPGGELEKADLPRLCEPFWRKEEAHSRREHLGLGLALASALAGLLGLELRFRLDGADRTFRAVLAGAVGPV